MFVGRDVTARQYRTNFLRCGVGAEGPIHTGFTLAQGGLELSM